MGRAQGNTLVATRSGGPSRRGAVPRPHQDEALLIGPGGASLRLPEPRAESAPDPWSHDEYNRITLSLKNVLSDDQRRRLQEISDSQDSALTEENVSLARHALAEDDKARSELADEPWSAQRKRRYQQIAAFGFVSTT